MSASTANMITYPMAVPTVRLMPISSSLFTVPRRTNTMMVVQMTMATGTERMFNSCTTTQVSAMAPTMVQTFKKRLRALSVLPDCLSCATSLKVYSSEDTVLSASDEAVAPVSGA